MLWNATGGTDTVILRDRNGPERSTLDLGDLARADVTLTRVRRDLQVTDKATGAVLTVSGQFADDNMGVAAIAFAGGAALDQAQISQEALFRIADDATRTYVQGSNVTVDLGRGGGTVTHSGGETGQTYLWAEGDGDDFIDTYTPTGSTDVLSLTDVDTSDVELARSGVDLLVKVLSSGETVKVGAQWYDDTDHRGVSLAFADGTTWNRDEITAHAVITGTGQGDTIYAPRTGATLVAGRGSDTFALSGTGADTIRFAKGDGHDTIDNPGSAYTRSDVLDLVGILSSDVTLTRDGDALTVAAPSTGDTVRVPWQFHGTGQDYGLGSMHFADGTAWDRAAIARHLAPSPH